MPGEGRYLPLPGEVYATEHLSGSHLPGDHQPREPFLDLGQTLRQLRGQLAQFLRLCAS
jgi:hypothetical protein